MTNEEKARQITDEVFVMDAIIGVETSKKIAEICCKKMAEWKDEQFQEQYAEITGMVKERVRRDTYAEITGMVCDLLMAHNKG